MIDAERGQRIHHGIGHCRRRAVGAGFADTFDSQRIERIRCYGFAQSESRHIARAHDRVIHQRAGENLALIAEEHLFAQRFTQPLRHTTVHLTLDDHRVDDYAAVVHQYELFNARLASFAIDADHSHVRAEAPGFASGIEKYRLLETGLRAGWNPSAV